MTESARAPTPGWTGGGREQGEAQEGRREGSALWTRGLWAQDKGGEPPHTCSLNQRVKEEAGQHLPAPSPGPGGSGPQKEEGRRADTPSLEAVWGEASSPSRGLVFPGLYLLEGSPPAPWRVIGFT